MGLLDEMVELTVDSDKRLSVVLRKCMVLSARLKNETLKDWSTRELNGYREREDLPDYRILNIQAVGHFTGPFQAGIRNAPLPPSSLPKEVRWWAEKAYLMQPIAAYEDIGSSSDGTVRIPWPQDLVALTQADFIQGYGLMQAWQQVPRNSVLAMLDMVRNRILALALEMQAETGGSYEKLAEADPRQIDRVITFHIYGGNNVIAGSAKGVVQVGQIQVGRGDMDALVDLLQKIGLTNSDIAGLRKAIAADDRSTVDGEIGQSASTWLTRTLAGVGKKVGAESLKVGTEVARTAITAAVMGYFGLS